MSVFCLDASFFFPLLENKLSFSCFRCTGTPLPLGYPVTAIKAARSSQGAYYDIAVAAHNKIYKYKMGTHPHEISPTEVIIQADGGWTAQAGGGRIRTIFLSGAVRGVAVAGTAWAAAAWLGMALWLGC